jgi:2',3'-cyclic-nucleotide 2'-phosphodiesterase (5'-nucleotidase family)
MLRTDTNETYEYGGLVYMASMIERLRKEYKGNVLYLDAGDEFQGGVESSTRISNGKIINEFFDQAHVDGAAIGNHDLDYGPAFLKNYMSERSTQSVFLAANLRSKTNGENFLPNSKATKIYTLKSGIKVGVIGLMTIETVLTINGYHNRSYEDYRILDYASIVLSLSKKLRKSGVHAVVLLSHVGN